MSKDLEFDSEEVRDFAIKDLSRIANYYDELANKLGSAGKDASTALRGIGEQGRSSSLFPIWDEIFSFHYKILYESGINIRTIAKYLIDVSKEIDLQEDDLSSYFEAAEELVETRDYGLTTGSDGEKIPHPESPIDRDDTSIIEEYGINEEDINDSAVDGTGGLSSNSEPQNPEGPH